jgi:hypothetical protein
MSTEESDRGRLDLQAGACSATETATCFQERRIREGWVLRLESKEWLCELRPALPTMRRGALTRKRRRGRVDDLGKEGADYEGPRAVQVMKIMELTKPTESSGRRPWQWERGPPYMAA